MVEQCHFRNADKAIFLLELTDKLTFNRCQPRRPSSNFSAMQDTEELSVLKVHSRVVRCAIRKDVLLFQPRNQVCIDRYWRVSKHRLTVNFFCDLPVVLIEQGGMDKGTLHFHSARQSTTPEGEAGDSALESLRATYLCNSGSVRVV